MTTYYSNKTTGAGDKSPGVGVAKFLFIVLLVVLFLFLAESMVHHRFFRGGSLNHMSSLNPHRTLKIHPGRTV
jgi:hypothetical protein